MNITDMVLPVHWYTIPCVHIWMLWPNLCNVRNHHYHCFLVQACLPQPGEVFDADTPCVAIGNNQNHIHPHWHYHYLRQDFHHRLSLIGVLSNSETIFFPFKDTAKMGPMIALAIRSTQNSWQRYQTLSQSWQPWLWWLWWLIMTFMSR